MSLVDGVVRECPGCGDLLNTPAPCSTCALLDASYEAAMKRQRIKAAMPRVEVGVVRFVETPRVPVAPVLAILAGIVVMTPVLLWATVHFGKLAILFLAGAH